ncbi:MAG: tetratricopeptide repeat protein [Caldilineaceae bacterium]|nr:tetratricopeptide repeat protein [Caldilineaceae bacterium]
MTWATAPGARLLREQAPAAEKAGGRQGRRGHNAQQHRLGSSISALGEKRQALDYYEQSPAAIQAGGDKRGEATTLNNIGRVYDALGTSQALDYYEQASCR